MPPAACFLPLLLLLTLLPKPGSSLCPGDNTIQCRSNICTRIGYICDGDNDCRDNSDEEFGLCQAWRNDDCRRGEVRCRRFGSSQCIPITAYCQHDYLTCEGTLDMRVCVMLKGKRLRPLHEIRLPTTTTTTTTTPPPTTTTTTPPPTTTTTTTPPPTTTTTPTTPPPTTTTTPTTPPPTTTTTTTPPPATTTTTSPPPTTRQYTNLHQEVGEPLTSAPPSPPRAPLTPAPSPLEQPMTNTNTATIITMSTTNTITTITKGTSDGLFLAKLLEAILTANPH